MQIPLLDLKAQYSTIKDDVDRAVKKVLDSQYFILSEEVELFEKEMASYAGSAFAAGVGSGTDALKIALRALGIEKGDIVVTTPFTFFATAETISVTGATPVFVDIDPDTYNMDPVKLEDMLSSCEMEELKKIKAVLPVHIYGQCADMDNINRIADKYGLLVIEDCAQAIGATYKGHQAGSLSDAGCFSFFPSKNLGAFGDGGMVTTADENLSKRVKKLRVHGSREQYIHEEIGFNSRLDSLQAAVLRVKLSYLNDWLERRRSIAKIYNEHFKPMGLKTPLTAEDNVHTYHQYTLSVDNRNEMLEFLRTKGIAARVYYPVPLHLQPCYKFLGVSIGSMPVCEKACERVLSLPIYPELRDDQIDHIVKSVTEFAKR